MTVGNLTKLLDAKGNLIKKALGITDLRMELLDDRVAFPWFDQVDVDSAAAYTHFISALCKMSRNAKRVTVTEKTVERGYLFPDSPVLAAGEKDFCLLLRRDFGMV